MAVACVLGSLGARAGICVGLGYESDGDTLVCRIFFSESAAVSGLRGYCADSDSADLVGNEEMGLLDSMAVCEYCKPDALPQGWTGVHADCQLPVLDKWRVVTVFVV